MSLLPSRGPETSTAQEGQLQVVGVDEEVAPIFDALSSDTAREVLNAIYEQPGTPSEIADRLDMSIQKVTYHLEKLADVDLIEVAGTRYSEKGQEMSVYEPPDEPLVLFVGTEERKRTLRSLVKRIVPTLGVLAVGSAVVQSVFGSTGDFGLGYDGADGEGAGEPQVTAADQPAMESRDDGGVARLTDSDAATEVADATATEAPPATGTPAATEAPQATGTPAGTGESVSIASTPSSTPVPEPTATAMPEAGGSNITDATPTAADAVTEGASVLEPGLAFFLGGATVLAVVGAWWYLRAR